MRSAPSLRAVFSSFHPHTGGLAMRSVIVHWLVKMQWASVNPF
jgi:hypothetical protein